MKYKIMVTEEEGWDEVIPIVKLRYGNIFLLSLFKTCLWNVDDSLQRG